MILPFLLAVAASKPLAALPGTDTDRFNACVVLTKAEPARAVTEAEAWAKQADTLPARHCLGLAYVAAERWTPAATTFTRAATAAEADNDQRAGLLWTQAGNAALAGDEPQLARIALDRALKLPGMTVAMQGEAWLDRARADVALADMAAARTDIDQGRRLVPDDPFAWLLSATLARRENDLPRAARDIAQAARLAPDDAAVALEAGNVAIAAGAEGPARVAWEKARALAPDEPAGQAAAAQLAELTAPEPATPAEGAAPDRKASGK